MRKFVVVAALLAVPFATAEVLYDSLSIVDGQQYFAGNGNAVSGMGTFGTIYDLQVADDFTVPAGGRILTTIVKDELTFMGGTPADGILVEVFQDLGGYPSETPVANYLATGGEVSGANFNDTLFYLLGRRYTADVSAGNIFLPAGSYFISAIPIDTSSSGDWYYTPRGNIQHGADAYGRDGGQDHLADGWYFGGYSGGYSTNDFVSFNSLGFGAGDSSMQINGVVPEPASLALLGLGLVLLRRR